MANDYMRLGSGFNTFEEVFPAYKTSPAQMIFQYAHNDYLQLLAEGGIVAAGLAIWFIVVWYREVTARWLTRRDPLAAYLTLAGMTAVFAMLIHSLTDFNLHIPANAIVTVTVLSITLNAARTMTSGPTVYPPSAEDTRGEGRGEGDANRHDTSLRADTHRQAGTPDSIERTVRGMGTHSIGAIIARLAQPEPLPDLSALCPDRQELTSILLEIRKGLRSSYFAELREAAALQHLDSRYMAQKAEALLASMHLASKTDYYAILEVDQDASTEEIHGLWIEKMRMYHPDNYEDPTGWIAEQSWSLNEAYAVLKDPKKRRDYDARRTVHIRSGHRTAGATDFLTPDRAIHSVSASSARSRLTRVVAIGAIVIASLLVALLLWSLP